ncbi:MAG: M48 family metalloprotease [Acidobacteria bacterium]|nr:M48 family metalloprotease [Acidobacteriota bacterium]
MRFTPKAPDESVNYSRENPLREALLLVAIVASLGAALLLSAGWIAEELIVRVPPAWESSLFGFVSKEFPPADDDRARRVAALLDDLDAERGVDLTLRVMDKKDLNAFAAPGGLIVVTTGLLDAVQSENELAFVLGHELGHFRHRDHLRALGRRLAMSLALSAASSAVGADVSSLGWIESLAELRFSRGQELEADAWGLELVARRYGHVAGAASFFDRLPRATSPVAKTAESFLSTHPISEERIRRVHELADRRGWAQTGSLTTFR